MKHQQSGSNTCCLSSLASALDAIGDHVASERLAGHIEASLSVVLDSRIQHAVTTLTDQKKTKGEQCLEHTVAKTWHEKDCCDPLSFENLMPCPTLLHLKDTALGDKHVVVTCGRCVLDSNCPDTLPLAKEWSDFCCDNVTASGEENICFLNVKLAIRFMPPAGMEKKMICLL